MRKSGRSALERRAALALLLVLALAALAAGWRVSRGRWVEGSFTALLPALTRGAAAQHALDTFRGRLDRQVVLLVGHSDPAVAKQAAARLARELAALPGVAGVRGAQSADALRRWGEFYAPYRWQLLTPALRHQLQAGQGHAWAQQVLAQVYSPTGGVGSAELRGDPFLLLRGWLGGLAQGAGAAFRIEDGWTLARDTDGTTHALILAELGFDAYSLDAVQAFADAFAEKEAALAAAFPGVTVNRRAVAFFAAAGARQARQEVSRIGIGATVGALAIGALVFRSALAVGLVFLAGTVGLLAGFSATLLVAGPLHLLTLVFGASLVGIADDYPVYFLCDRLVSGAAYRPLETRRRIARGLTFCLATSVLAYLALLVAPAPVLRQIALFSAVGLLATFGVVMLGFPVLVPRPTIRGWRELAPFRAWQSAGARLGGRSGWVLLALGAALAAGVVGIRVDDDVRQLQALPGALLRQDATVSRLTGIEAGTQLLLVHGATPEALLQRLEAAGEALARLEREGALRGHRSLSDALPSQARQAEDRRLVEARLVQAEYPSLAAALGLPRAAPRLPPFTPLTPQAWLASPVSGGLRDLLVLDADGGAHAAVVLRDVERPDALAQAFAGAAGVETIDAAGEITRLLGTYRNRVAALTAAAYALILLLLARWYGLGRALRVLAPPLLGGAAALVALRLLGQPLNLFAVFGVVLVLGAGIDFPLILAENREHHPATQFSVPYSTATTLLSFGLLALSSTPAIANFGLVVLIGVAVSGVLAPLALPPRPADPLPVQP